MILFTFLCVDICDAIAPPTLVGKIPVRLKEILQEVARNYRLKIIAQEVMPDHVHLLVETPPTMAPTKIVQYFKGISSAIKKADMEGWCALGNRLLYCLCL